MPFFLGSITLIFILPKIFQIIIVQILFIIMNHFYTISGYYGIYFVDGIAYKTDYLNIPVGLFIVNSGSILLVLLIKFGYTVYRWCIYRLQGK